MTKKNTRHETGQRNTRRQNTTDANKIRELAVKAIKEMSQCQGKRAVRHLVENGIASTADIAGNCAIGNVSDAVLRVQPQLQKHGVCIAHTHPQGFTNRFGEPTPMHLWWLALVEPVGVSQ